MELHGVTVAAAERTLVDSLDWHCRRGAKILLSGPSGCGKTTLLRCIAGLARPAEGTLSLFGTVMDRRSVWALRKRIAYVAQTPVLGAGPVLGALREPFQFRANQDRIPPRDSILKWLDHLNLPASLAERNVADLSGGERHRIALLGALLLDRPLLLLDEITAGLHKDARLAVVRLLERQTDRTVIAVSHDPEWREAGFLPFSLDVHAPSDAAACSQEATA